MPTSPNNLTQREAREAEHGAQYNHWRDTFIDTRAGAIALRALINLTTDNNAQFEELKEFILKACFNAYSFSISEETDYRSLVIQLKEFSHSQKEYLQAIRKVRAMSRKFPLLVSQILRYGHNPIEGQPTRVGSRFKQEPSETLLAMLAAFEDGLPRFNRAKPDLELEFGRIEGCLRYPSKRMIKASRLSGATNSIVFELTLLMRRWSMQASLNIYNGDIMEDAGEPHFPVVAAFANATLPEANPRTATSVRSRLKKLLLDHPGINYCPW